jgi:RimJ/RimL family protein N-acetyltransferase
VLRLHTPQDFTAIHAMSGGPAMWTYSERGPMAPEESWAQLLRHAGHWALHGYGVFAVEEKETGLLVGEAGFADFHRGFGGDFDPFPEACWSIRTDRQERGYATEAAAAALAWTEAKMGANRTVCLIHADNVASHRVATKLGYASFRPVKYRGYRALLLQREPGLTARVVGGGRRGAAPGKASSRTRHVGAGLPKGAAKGAAA